MELIDKHIIILIATHLNIKEVINLCVNKLYKELLVDNNYFWKSKCIKDYNVKDDKNVKNWKDEYFSGDVWLTSNIYDGKLPLPDGTKIKIIASSERHSLMIDTNNNVWAMGNNAFGQLGIGDNTHRKFPEKINNFLAKNVAVGGIHSLFTDTDNNLYYSGIVYGQHVHKPTPLNIKVKAIACGYRHFLFIDMDNILWSCGENKSGQLGTDNYENYSQPVCLNIKAKSIACGYYHNLFIDMNGNAWSFGNNDGTIKTYNGCFPPTMISMPHKIKYISAGHDHSVLIDVNNNIYWMERIKSSQCITNKPKYITNKEIKNIFSDGTKTFLIDMNNNICSLNDDNMPYVSAKAIGCGYKYILYITI